MDVALIVVYLAIGLFGATALAARTKRLKSSEKRESVAAAPIFVVALLFDIGWLRLTILAIAIYACVVELILKRGLNVFGLPRKWRRIPKSSTKFEVLYNGGFHGLLLPWAVAYFANIAFGEPVPWWLAWAMLFGMIWGIGKAGYSWRLQRPAAA